MSSKYPCPWCFLTCDSNFLDRDALGGLAVAIRDWAGAVVIISHNEEFVGALCEHYPRLLSLSLTNRPMN